MTIAGNMLRSSSRWLLLGMLIAATVAGIALPRPAQASGFDTLSSCKLGYYCGLQSAANLSMCLDVNQASTANSVKLQLWRCKITPNQRISYSYQGLSNGHEVYLNKFEHSIKCIDIPGASSQAGVVLQQYTCNWGDHQKWVYEEIYGDHQFRIRSLSNGLCMSANSAVQGGLITQQNCNTSLNQKWNMWHH